ncbi:MAG: hypothetical protein H7833_09810 [Magnetococcus sp. DMHC-1]|nr:hypothetical protein [Magnetococcales bacterium]
MGDDHLFGHRQGLFKAWQKDVVEPEVALRRKIGMARTMGDMARLIGEGRGKQDVAETIAVRVVGAVTDIFL